MGKGKRLPLWTPFVRAALRDGGKQQELIRHLVEVENISPEQARHILEASAGDEIWINSRYQVVVRWLEPTYPNIVPMAHLSIKRLDKEPVGEEKWRDFQRIKNELVGPECEGFELYPAESRVVDTANQYHVWVVADPKFTFGFGLAQRGQRLVNGKSDPVLGSKQRPL